MKLNVAHRDENAVTYRRSLQILMYRKEQTHVTMNNAVLSSV